MSTTGTAIFGARPSAAVHVERSCACPFSIADEYAARFLAAAERGGPEAFVRAPFAHMIPALRRKVRISFGRLTDVSEQGRAHDQIRLRWLAGSTLLPDFRGTLRFRIDRVGTRIMLDGTYKPPLGPFGLVFDRLLGRWLARATLDDFARRIATYLEDEERNWRLAR
jgi:hypothetical protein